MNKLITHIKRLALALCLATPCVSWAVTTSGYEDFGDTAGVVLWRATGAIFHNSTVIDVAEDGTPGTAYAMDANNGATSWQRFGSNQNAYSAPGKVLVYDRASSDDETPVDYTQNSEAQFSPLSFGGMWVKTLAANGSPFKIGQGGTRVTEFGATGNATLFKFEKSFTIDRQGSFNFYGTVNVDVEQDAVFSINGSYPHQAISVPSGSTFKPTGAGSISIGNTDNGLSVAGALDLTAETRPTLTGKVTIADGASLVLPVGTAIGETVSIPVCSGTLAAAGLVNVKVGDADAVPCVLTISGGTITKIEYNATEQTFYDNWPSVVPNGCTYTFVGGATEAETVTNDVALTVNGALKTSGYIVISSLTLTKEKTLEVLDGKTTVTAPADKALSGDITIDSGATLVNTRTDALNYSWGVYVFIYGTLDMGTSRWTVGSNARIHLYDGGQIVGTGDGNGALDIFSANVRIIADGDSTISANLRTRTNHAIFEALEGKTLTLSGSFLDGNAYDQPGGITKENTGTLVFSTAPAFTGEFLHEAGTLELGGTATAANVTVSNSTATVTASTGSTLTGELTFTAHVPSAANKSLITSDAFAGTVVLSGDFGSASGNVVSLAGLGDDVTLRNFTGFLNKGWDATDTRITIEGTFTQSNGWSGDTTLTKDAVYIAELLGDGTMTQSGAQAQSYIIGSIENFTGTFNLSNARIKSNGNAVLDKAQTVATLTVADTLTVTEGGSLTGNLSASDIVVTTTQTIAVGDVIVPVSGTVAVSGTVTLNGEPVEFACVDGEGVVLAGSVSITVPVVANTTVAVTVDATPVDPDTEGGNVYTVDYGAAVVVTYSVDPDAYEITGGTIEFTATESIEVAQPTVTAYKAWTQDDIGATVNSYTDVALALSAFGMGEGNAIRFLEFPTAYDATLLEFCSYDATTITYTRLPTVATITAGQTTYQYPSLRKAIAEAQAGDTIVLVADDAVSFSADNLEIAIDQAITINGAGFTVYGVADYAGGNGDHDIYISGSGDVTISNVTLTAFAGDVECNYRTYPIWTGSSYTGTLTLDSVTVTSFNRTAFNLNGGTVLVKDCTITGDTTKASYFQTGIESLNADVTIEGTTITGIGSTLEWAAGCVQLGNANAVGTGTILIKSGTYTGENAVIVAEEASDSLTIEGGTFTGALMVEDGTGGSLVISGGTFNGVDPTAYVVSGKKAYEDTTGVWTVQNLKVFTVTFDSNGGSAVAAQDVVDGGKATEPDPAPTKANNTFDGWTLNDAAYDFDTPVTASITLTATWTSSGPTPFDGGDGSTTFTIANQDSITLPDGKALADVASAATGLTYAQAWALGLLDETTGELTSDLAATINVASGKVVVALNSTPQAGYIITLKVYAKASLDAEWPAEPTKTYSVANATTAAFDVGTVGFYKVAVKISNALMD